MNTDKALRLAAVVAALFGVTLAGCAGGTGRDSGTSAAGAAQNRSRPDALPQVAQGSSLATGDLGTFTNSVPEQPWWQASRGSEPPAAVGNRRFVLSGDVLFRTASAALSPAAQSQLAGVLQAALQPGAMVTIVGSTDDIPIDIPGGNLALSEERAVAVARWLEAEGVPAGRIRASGLGDADPVASNTTAEGRQANRRVAITVDFPGSKAS